MKQFQNLINRQIDLRVSQIPHPKWGTVTAYDPTTHTARITLEPEGVLSGWLPIISPYIGNQWGLMAPLMQGQQCVAIPHDGSLENMAVIGMAHSEVNAPPSINGNYAAPGEFLLYHQSGSYLYFQNSGDVQLVTKNNLSATVGGNLSIISTGTAALRATGNLSVDSSGNIVVTSTGETTISGSSINLDSTNVISGNGTAQRLATESFVQQIYDAHTHSGVETGGGTTGVPTILSNASSLTTQFSAT